MSDLFSDIPWFLQEHVHSQGWTEFRSIQTDAYSAFLQGDGHILISAGTSGGKTEAAMFPVIASLYREPAEGIGAMYIGPLKALIDDQFERLSPILKDSGIKVTGWHGDVGQHIRDRMVKRPEGILQITPESLQNIITNRNEELVRMFSDLRFVIIDEVHAFMNSDRGLQLLCCLEQLERLSGCRPRRFGLSATISDMDSACRWLSANTGRETVCVKGDAVEDRTMEIRYNLFPAECGDDPDGRKRAVTRYYRELYSDVAERSCIVFTNSRDSAEKTAHSLSKMAELYGRPGTVFIHHGSVSHELRRNAEEALKSQSIKNTVVATVTLELGIDVGNLDRVIQIGAPYTCSGLVQRMGRSGRRGNGQNMILYCNDDLTRPWAEVDGMSMDLVRCVAMAELILKEGWTEPPDIPKLPYGLLYHQTLQYLKPGIGASLKDLYSEVLSLYPFRSISKEDYKVLLRHMLKTGHLERMEDGTFLIGPEGERNAFGKEFCAVFTAGKEFDIHFDGKTIGSIQIVPAEGELIQLAGRVWEVVSINRTERYADVRESDGTVSASWSSSVPGLDTRILKKMKEVLVTSRGYDYLDADADSCLRQTRNIAYGNDVGRTFVKKGKGFRIYPWLGTRQFDTLKRAVAAVPDVSAVRCRQPYYMDVATDLSEGQLRSEINDILEKADGRNLIWDSDDLQLGKYDVYVPESLLRKQFLADRIDRDFSI